MKCSSLPMSILLVLKSTLSGLNMVMSCFLRLAWTWCIFFHLFTFNLSVSLYLKWTSWKYTVVWYLLFCPDWQFSPLTAIINPFICNMISVFECKSTLLLLAFYFFCVYFFILFLSSFTVESFTVWYFITSLRWLLFHFVLSSTVFALSFTLSTFNLSQSVFKQCYAIYITNIINLK